MIFIQLNWNSLVQNSPKAVNYKTFKTEFKYEEYLNILEIKDAILLCRFRTTNNKLPIETGRWQNIPRANRKYNNNYLQHTYKLGERLQRTKSLEDKHQY
jgi:hypothetical protein